MKTPRLREWREARGETQLTLAERAGLTEHTISRIEHGYELRPGTARKLADALGVEIADLMENPPILAGTGKDKAPTSGPARAAEEVARDAAERAQQLAEDVPRRMQEIAGQAVSGPVHQSVSGPAGAQEPTASELLEYFLAAGMLTEDDLQEGAEALRRRHVTQERHPTNG